MQPSLACLLSLKQACVLDCDDSLVGEAFQQLDLDVREGDRLAPNDVDYAYCSVTPQHRHRQARSVANDTRALGAVWIGEAVLGVGYGDYPTLEQRAGRQGPFARRGRICASDERRRLW